MNINLNLDSSSFYLSKELKNQNKRAQEASNSSSQSDMSEMIEKLKKMIKELEKQLEQIRVKMKELSGNENPYAKEMLNSLSAQSSLISSRIAEINAQILNIIKQQQSAK